MALTTERSHGDLSVVNVGQCAKSSVVNGQCLRGQNKHT